MLHTFALTLTLLLNLKLSLLQSLTPLKAFQSRRTSRRQRLDPFAIGALVLLEL